MAWKKGKQIEVRIAKKALQNLFIPQFQRMLNDEEVRHLHAVPHS